MTLTQETVQAKDAAALALKRAETAEAALLAKDQTFTALEAANKDLAAKVASLTTAAAQASTDLAARDKTISDLTSKVAATEADVDRRAGVKAAATLAKSGVKPVAETPTAGASSTDLWAQYNTMPDAKAKREFYLANQEQM